MFNLTLKDPDAPKNSITVPVAMSSSTSSGICLKVSRGRGVGTPLINRCQSNEEGYGALCYPKCRDGYESVGCCLCRQRQCPSGFKDDGVATCIKPAAYGRGVGYPWKISDGLNDKGMFKRCEADHGAGNCEKSLAIVYPKCQYGFDAAGCCLCSPSCPAEMMNHGISCGKSTYGRGVGVSRLGCASNNEQNAGLCYKFCDTGFYGVGPVCWQSCQGDTSYDCGVMCATDKKTCEEATLSIVAAGLKVGINLLTQNYIGATGEAIKTILSVTSNRFC